MSGIGINREDLKVLIIKRLLLDVLLIDASVFLIDLEWIAECKYSIIPDSLAMMWMTSLSIFSVLNKD